MLNDLFEKWKSFASYCNSKGVPVPTIRDPKTGNGSITATLLFISSLAVVIGLAGKWSAKFGTIDMANALQFFGICFAGYLGRKLHPCCAYLFHRKESRRILYQLHHLPCRVSQPNKRTHLHIVSRQLFRRARLV